MNTPIPSGPERRSGRDGTPPDSGAPARMPDGAGGDLAHGMDPPVSGQPPDTVPDDEYEPL